MSSHPSRAAGLARLSEFLPQAGSAYAARRNFDPGPGEPAAVSGLSPWLRHRLVTETEVIAAVLERHPPANVRKFLDEVLWRTYWKGWLELRPQIHRDYRSDLARTLEGLEKDRDLRSRYEAAVDGRTGIGCFDHWVEELTKTGSLHNHARMWFASIWCFTLLLPWQLGADFFLRHLIDGDAASNTLSWRWVAGLQTRGKHYVARAENIARYTLGRFDPAGQLDERPEPLSAPPHPPVTPLAEPPVLPAGPAVLLLHEEDLGVESLDIPAHVDIRQVAVVVGPEERSPLGCSPLVSAWVRGAAEDARARAERRFAVSARLVTAAELPELIDASGVSAVVTPWAPCGWAAARLDEIARSLGRNGIPLLSFRRSFDSRTWPLARKGYFDFRQAIPADLLAPLYSTSG